MSNFYTCLHCGKSIEISQKDIHENYCLYVPKKEEFNDLIPCEICNNFINFSDYQEHIESCGTLGLGTSIPIISSDNEDLRNMMSALENFINQTNNNVNNSDIDDEAANNLESNNEESNNEESNNEDANIEVNEQTQNEPQQTNTNPFDSLFPLINNPNIFTTINPVYNNPINLNQENIQELPSLQEIFNQYNTNSEPFTDSYIDLTNLSEEIGDVEIGIENLDDVLTDIEIETDQKIVCPICQNEHSSIKKTLCNHDFCYECISTWLSRKKTCPICLKDLTEINKNE